MLLRRNRGFTLIEMMIVLVIAGIIFFTAMPGYRHVLIKGHRTIGKAIMLDVMSRQAQYLINHGQYASDLPALGLPAHYFVDSESQTCPPERSIYKIELLFASEKFDGVRALPQNLQLADEQCMVFSLNLEGLRSVSGALAKTPGRCW